MDNRLQSYVCFSTGMHVTKIVILVKVLLTNASIFAVAGYSHKVANVRLNIKASV